MHSSDGSVDANDARLIVQVANGDKRAFELLYRGYFPRLTRFLTLGAHHGLFCVGCCWALMLLMFAFGAGNLGGMLALAVVMAIEKNLPWGERLRAPLGIALLTWAAIVVATHA